MMAMGRMMQSRGTRSAAWLAASTLAVLGIGWFHARATALRMNGAWLERMQAPGARLTQIDFRGAILVAANLDRACLDGCNLSDANLNNANLGSASLQHACLVHTNLCNANLGGANLRHADLSGARLENANFQFVDLQGANLQAATYNRYTTLPDGCDPAALGMRLIDTD